MYYKFLKEAEFFTEALMLCTADYGFDAAFFSIFLLFTFWIKFVDTC